METLEQQFNSRVRVFLGRTGVSPTTFGMKALGDPNLMRQLDGGRSLSLRTADRVLAFVADYDLDSGGPRTPPRGHRRRKPSSRARRTRRSRAMTGARLTAALECANDAGGRCALWPSGDAHACYGVSHDTATSCTSPRGRRSVTAPPRAAPRASSSPTSRHRALVTGTASASTARTGGVQGRGPGTGSGAGVFAHLPPPSYGVAPEPSIPPRVCPGPARKVGPEAPATLAARQGVPGSRRHDPALLSAPHGRATRPGRTLDPSLKGSWRSSEACRPPYVGRSPDPGHPAGQHLASRCVSRRRRPMTGARLTAALECANDAGGRCALWPSGDAHACYGVSHDTATSCAFAAGSVSAARAALTGTGATPQSEGLVRVRIQVCLRTCPRPPGVAPEPSILPGRVLDR